MSLKEREMERARKRRDKNRNPRSLPTVRVPLNKVAEMWGNSGHFLEGGTWSTEWSLSVHWVLDQLPGMLQDKEGGSTTSHQYHCTCQGLTLKECSAQGEPATEKSVHGPAQIKREGEEGSGCPGPKCPLLRRGSMGTGGGTVHGPKTEEKDSVLLGPTLQRSSTHALFEPKLRSHNQTGPGFKFGNPSSNHRARDQ